MRPLVIALFILGVIAVAGLAGYGIGRDSTSCPKGVADGELLASLNAYRMANGLQSLTIDEQLQAAAEWFAGDLATSGTLSHTDSQGRQIVQRLTDYGYPVDTYKAEAVAMGYSTAAEVLAAWEMSPPHNAILLDSHTNRAGIGQSDSYWVLDVASDPVVAVTLPPELTPEPTIMTTPTPSIQIPVITPTETACP